MQKRLVKRKQKKKNEEVEAGGVSTTDFPS